MTLQFAPRSQFDEIIALVNSGDSAGAESICRQAVERNPRDVNMLALLGAILIKMRRHAEAEKTLRNAIALAPTFAKPYEDLGHVLLELARAREAVEVLQTATRLDPNSETAFLNLGKALAATGRGKEADAAFEKTFALSPEKKALAYASRHHQENRLEDAERIYRDVLRRNPENVDACRLLANVVARTKRPDEAERLLRRAIQVAPDFVGAHTDLGKLLKDQDRYQEATACFRSALAIQPNSARIHYLLGSVLSAAVLTGAGILAYRKALELNPKHAGAWLGLGHSLKTIGRQEEAIEAYRECARLRPDNGEIYWSLANLKTYRFSEQEIAWMRERTTAGQLQKESEINFLFALAKAHEDRGEFETAWRYYRDGNTRRREDEWYDAVYTEVMNDSIIRVFNRALLDGKSDLGCPDPAPIFIVGLPRSGSTLIEQILASHSDVEGTAELPYLGRIATSLNRNRADGVNYPEAVGELQAEHFQAMGEEYLSFAKIHRVRGAPRFIDKMPNNFPNIGLLRLILPNARIIDARRHPLDACLSCYRQLFAKGQPFTYDLVDIGEYYLQYQRIMDHWNAVMPGRVLTVQYEELVSDFEYHVRRLLEFCGLAWEDNCLRYYQTERPVRTASSEQVRQPLYTESIGRWRNYEKHLGELIEVLKPILPRYEKFIAAAWWMKTRSS